MPSPRPSTTGVLFVCLGNICRSPLAEVIFRDLAARRSLLDRLDIDSCGTSSYHAGGDADPRSISTAAANGLRLCHTARQLDPTTDFDRFHWIVPMDRQNEQAILRLGADRERVRLMRSFARATGTQIGGKQIPELDVPDPYYGGDDGFDHVFRMLQAACEGLLDHVAAGMKP